MFYFYFHPENWGRWTHFDEHIFQMGWFNHHLEWFSRPTKLPLGSGFFHSCWASRLCTTAMDRSCVSLCMICHSWLKGFFIVTMVNGAWKLLGDERKGDERKGLITACVPKANKKYTRKVLVCVRWTCWTKRFSKCLHQLYGSVHLVGSHSWIP